MAKVRWRYELTVQFEKNRHLDVLFFMFEGDIIMMSESSKLSSGGLGSCLASAGSILGGEGWWVACWPWPSAVTWAITVVVSLACTGVSEWEVGWWGWGSGTSSDEREVWDVQVWLAGAWSPASISPQPWISGLPVGEGEGHTVGEVKGHVWDTSTVPYHWDWVRSLGHGDIEGWEWAIAFLEVNLVVEWFSGINSHSWSVLSSQFLASILLAWSTSVALVVVSHASWGITRE